MFVERAKQPKMVKPMLMSVLHMAAPIQYCRLSSKYLKPTLPKAIMTRLSLVYLLFGLKTFQNGTGASPLQGCHKEEHDRTTNSKLCAACPLSS